jgi:hypothetical protein
MNLASIDFIDFSSFLEYVMRFALNMTVILLLVRWLYYGSSKRKDYLFTYVMISAIVFMLCFLLESVKLQLGFALGLFAIFGIMRYRTDAIPIREMTYIFLVIGVSVINALTSTKTSLADLIFTNAVIVFIVYGFERVWLLQHIATKEIKYEKIELIKPDRYEELLKDVTERTGIKKIKRIETGRIDFLTDTCILTLFYEAEKVTGAQATGARVNDDDDD